MKNLILTYRRGFLMAFIFAILLTPAQASLPIDMERYLLSLDSVMDNHLQYEEQFEEGINRLKQELDNATDEEHVYQINQMLGIMYSSFIADSALYYQQINEDYALNKQRKDYLNEIFLGRARLFTSVGLLSEAEAEFGKIDLSDMPEAFISNYYAIRLHAAIQKSRMTADGLPTADSQVWAEQLKQHSLPGDKLNEALQVLWNYHKSDRQQQLIAVYENLLEESLQHQDLHAVHAAYMLSGAYAAIGDEEMALKNLCLSSEIAIKYCDRELNALTDLIVFLMNHEDYERAYRYINFVLESQENYPDRVRSLQVAQNMRQLSDEMLQISKKQQDTILKYLYVVAIAFVIVGVLLVVLFLMYRRLNRQKDEIDKINNSLVNSNAHIQEINRELNNANYIKEAYIASLFSSCANYLNLMDGFRSDIYRKARGGKMDEVLEATAPDSPLIHQEAKELNRSFDETFLTIYPSFVADFNSLLNEEEQLSAKEGSLNTELRIYALIWLGFSNGNKIANLLHVTPKTVYNAIARVRSKAKEPNLTAEQFNAAVCLLGRKRLRQDS